jgi:hypothetical protein
MDTHWSKMSKLGKCRNRVTKGTNVQTFFENHPIFFAVNPQLDADGPRPSLFNLYIERFEGEMEKAQERQVLPPESENEITPLLKVMLWHEHLGPFLIDQKSPSDTSSDDGFPPSGGNTKPASPIYLRENIAALRSIVALPKRLCDRIPLRLITFSYLSKVKREFKLCEPRAKRMLTEYPSGEMWKMIDDGSLHTYGIILRKLIYSVFVSCEDHSSRYSLPLSDDDRKRAAEFKEALEIFAAELEEIEQDEDDVWEDDEILEEDEDEILEDNEIEGDERVGNKKSAVVPDDLVASFHRLVKPFLYPRPSTSHSRWDDPLECFIALFSLSKTANFKAAEDMTQPFAHLHYLMRSAIFYEALCQWKKSTGDLPFEE